MQVLKTRGSVFVKAAALEEKVYVVGGVWRACEGLSKQRKRASHPPPPAGVVLFALDRLAQGHPLSPTWRGGGAEHPPGRRAEGGAGRAGAGPGPLRNAGHGGATSGEPRLLSLVTCVLRGAAEFGEGLCGVGKGRVSLCALLAFSLERKPASRGGSFKSFCG